LRDRVRGRITLIMTTLLLGVGSLDLASTTRRRTPAHWLRF